MDFELFAFPPVAPLAPFVETVWGVRAAGGHDAEAVLPNGAVELMINFGPEQRVLGHGERTLSLPFRRAWLAGMQDRRLVHAGDSGADHLSVRFRPGGAHAFFDLPMAETSNRVLELSDVLGAEADALRDRVGAHDDDLGRAFAVQAWLVERMRVAPVFPTVQRAIGLLTSVDRRSSVGRVCERLGLSNKGLIDQFRRTVGLTPKVIGRIDRFQAVIGACRGRHRVEWRTLAHAHGYADQSHLIREFRRLGGVTPSQFLERRSADDSAVVVPGVSATR